MASTPLNDVGGITSSQECWGQNLFRDNTGNGNLILCTQYTNTDIRVSADNGATWSEPTGTSSPRNELANVWMQDSSGNLHMLCMDASFLIYVKGTVTRTAGDITDVTFGTAISLNALVTNSVVQESLSIAEVNDSSATTPGKKDTGRVHLTGGFDVGTNAALTEIVVSGPGTLAVQDLQFIGSRGAAMFTEWTTDEVVIEVDRCFIEDTGTSGGAGNSFACTDATNGSITVRNTAFFVSNTSALMDCARQDSAAAKAGVTFDSCTFVNRGSSGDGIENTDATHAITVNNCLVEVATTTVDQVFVNSGGGGFTGDYNVAGGAASSVATVGANGTEDQSSAQLASEDIANGDLRIGSGSTAIDAGSTTLTEDVTGMSRFTPHDAGFYDFTRGLIINDTVNTSEFKELTAGGVTLRERNILESVILKEKITLDQTEVIYIHHL